MDKNCYNCYWRKDGLCQLGSDFDNEDPSTFSCGDWEEEEEEGGGLIKPF